MNAKKPLIAVAVGIAGALTFGRAAFADPAPYRPNYDHHRRPTEVRRNWNELQNRRADLRNDGIGALRERREVRRAFQRGASPEKIARERREFTNRLREFREDRRDLRRYWRHHRWYRDHDDRGYGYSPYRYGWYDDDRGWWNHDHGNHYGWWGHNRNRYGFSPYSWRGR